MRLLPVLLAAALCAAAQHQPFPVHDVRAAIVSGPYLLAPTETSVTVVWRTDVPAHAKVVYGRGGALDQTAEPHEHGLKPVGTLHAVRIEGLEPGATYRYQAVSTPVVKMKSYWPEKGQQTSSPVYSFTPFDRRKQSFTFYAITDTHADLARIAGLVKLVDWNEADFLVHLGDAFDAEDEELIWTRWLDALGAAARALPRHFPPPEGRYYYARDHGAAHFMLLDTGEDKPDDTNVYARLNAFAAYKREQFAWWRDHVRAAPRVREAPFRILFMHAPDWGWNPGGGAEWTALARAAGVDLSLSGHTHRFAYTPPGAEDRGWHRLVLAPAQTARVAVTPDRIEVRVLGAEGEAVRFTVPRRR